MSTIRRPICPVKETSLKPIGDEEFLRLVWPDKLLTHETLELRAFNRTESAIERKFATSIDQFLAFAHSYGEGWDVYFGVATRFREGGKKQNCYRVRTMWADLDHRRIEECLDFDPKPGAPNLSNDLLR